MTDPYSPENVADTIDRVSRIGGKAAGTAVSLAKKAFYIMLIIVLIILSCLNLVMYLCTPSVEDAGTVLPKIWLTFVSIVQLLYYFGMFTLVRKIFGKGKCKKKDNYDVYENAAYQGKPQPRWKKQSDMNSYRNYYEKSVRDGKYDNMW